MAISKVIFGGDVLINLESDTVSADTLALGVTAHDCKGEVITGTSTNDSDTSDATAIVGEILNGKTAYVRGAKVTGNMVNNGGVTAQIKDLNAYTIPVGYHDGSGRVSVDGTGISAGNIKSGITILGVKGTYTGAGVKLQSKTATPSKTQQTIQADSNYDALSSVTVEAIPYSEAPNAAGGTTVTIG